MSVTRTYNISLSFTVDDEDVDLLDKLDAQYASGKMVEYALYSTGYNISSRGIQGLWRIIAYRKTGSVPMGMHVDHVNNDRGDNIRENLRVVTHNENHANRRNSQEKQSEYVGVSWNKASQSWNAAVSFRQPDGRRKTLTKSRKDMTEADAAIWYDLKVRELNLPNARNFTMDELNQLILVASAI